VAALDTLKPADINYVKKLGNPPFVIKLVLEAVCVLLGEKPARVKDESGKSPHPGPNPNPTPNRQETLSP